MSISADKIAVIGATGNTGRELVRRLAHGSGNVVAIARSAGPLQALGSGIEIRSADAGGDLAALRRALADAAIVVNVAHARFTRSVIAALPNANTRLITLGSTRMFTRFPDQKAAEVADAQAAHAQHRINGLTIHPTMIYGGSDNNIRRMVRLVRQMPLVPLPRGGAALLQPIHRDDVVASILAAVAGDIGTAPLVIAGAAPMPYAEIVRACARAIGRKAHIVSIPVWFMMLAAPSTRILPSIPTISRDEVRRLTENKDFDIGPMRTRLGIKPMDFEEGLARMAAAGELG